MGMTPEQARLHYQGLALETASPAEQVLRCHDQLASDLAAAERLMREVDAVREQGGIPDYYEVNAALSHAGEVIAGLRDALDKSTELGRALHALYSYFLKELLEANFEKKPERIAPVRELHGQIHAANRTAVEQMKASAVPAGAL